MRVSWLVSSILVFSVGFLFSTNIIGIIIGLPLMILSIAMLTIGVILPEKPIPKLKKRKKK